MPFRVPYETVSFHIESMWFKALSSGDDLIDTYDKVIEFIEACGWSDREFDEETLKRVDANWDDETPPSN
jgi:hypothetical protein